MAAKVNLKKIGMPDPSFVSSPPKSAVHDNRNCSPCLGQGRKSDWGVFLHARSVGAPMGISMPFEAADKPQITFADAAKFSGFSTPSPETGVTRLSFPTTPSPPTSPTSASNSSFTLGKATQTHHGSKPNRRKSQEKLPRSIASATTQLAGTSMPLQMHAEEECVGGGLLTRAEMNTTLQLANDIQDKIDPENFKREVAAQLASASSKEKIRVAAAKEVNADLHESHFPGLVSLEFSKNEVIIQKEKEKNAKPASVKSSKISKEEENVEDSLKSLNIN